MFYGGNWPPSSPDMNPIEHLWPLVGRKLTGRVFANKAELWEALKVAFGLVKPAEILRLYDSMPHRIAALAAAKGRHTRY